jgi:hypothetical protein
MRASKYRNNSVTQHKIQSIRFATIQSTDIVTNNSCDGDQSNPR